MTDAELDRWLGEAMRAWPTPAAGVDLAAVAMDRARAAAVRRVRRWATTMNAIAVVVAIGVVAALVRARLAGGGFSAWTDGSAVASAESTTPWLLVGAALSMAAVAVVAIRLAWDVADDGLAVVRPV